MKGPCDPALGDFDAAFVGQVLGPDPADYDEQERDATFGRRGRMELAAFDGCRHSGLHQLCDAQAGSVGTLGGSESGYGPGEHQFRQLRLPGGEPDRFPGRGADRCPARTMTINGGGEQPGMDAHAAFEQGVVYGVARAEVLNWSLWRGCADPGRQVAHARTEGFASLPVSPRPATSRAQIRAHI